MRLHSVPARLYRERSGFVACGLALAALTAILAPLLGSDQLLDVALVYLFVALAGSAIWGYRVGLASAIVANILVNLFFVPPTGRLTVQQPENVVGLGLFMAVAAIGALMFARLRRQLLLAEARRAENALLLELSQTLAHAANARNALQQFCTTAARGLGAQGCAILRSGPPWSVAATTGTLELTREEEAMAAEALSSGSIVRSVPATRRTVARAATTQLTFVPLGGPERGCLRFVGQLELPPLVQEGHLLTVLAGEAGLSLQRARLADEAALVEALHRADELKTALLSSISHDLRTPLTAIKASVESLRDTSISWSDDDRASFLQTIEAETDRLTETITNLLEMSRLEGGATSVHLERVDVAALASDVAAAVRTVTGDRDLDICVDDGLAIRADYTLVLRALINLVENAAKYSTPGMPIAIRARAGAGVARITVADCGPGIPAAEVPHIFEKLYRGSHAGRVRGSGLGLSIVQAMVTLSGGSIEVRSSPDGTTFVVEFPMKTVPA